jgi:hypothetical protein
MAWSRLTIRDKVRDLVGMPSANQISDADINVYINDFYQYQLPDEVDLEDLDTWFSMTTTSGQGDYPLEARIQVIENPVTIDGAEITLYSDINYFFELYPRDNEGTATYAEPAGVIVYDRRIYYRPIPDAGYVFKAAVPKRPVELTDDADGILDEKWGLLIAYGAAVNIMMEFGDTAAATELGAMYERYKSSLVIKNLYRLIDTRAVPRW